MHDLQIIDRLLINTSAINTLASLLETAMTNTIYLIKPKQLYIYKELKVIMSDNTSMVLDESTSIGLIKELNNKSRDVFRLIITGYNGSVIDLSELEIRALRGFKLVNNIELAIEYYKSTIFDILYNSELTSLCRRNPAIEDYSIDIMDVIEASPSICLSDDIIEQINQALLQYPDILTEINRDLSYLGTVIHKYVFNPKEFSITRYGIRIHILEDIRVIRFNEILNGGDVDDNEDNSGVYITK